MVGGSFPPAHSSSCSLSPPVHAAVIAINDAIDHGEPGGTMAAMRNPNAMLVNLDEGSSQRYQHTLQQAKQDKVANARKRVTTLPIIGP